MADPKPGPSGIKAAIEATRDAARGPVPQAEQLDLMPLSRSGVGEFDPLPAEERALAEPGKPGRPPGAKNKRTEAWVTHILGRYRSPLIQMAEICARPVHILAHELGCTRFEAFQIQLEAMKQLAPYLHQKLPQAIDLNGEGLVAVNLIVQGDDLPKRFRDDGRPVEATVLENEQNQDVNTDDPARVGQSGVGQESET